MKRLRTFVAFFAGSLFTIIMQGLYTNAQTTSSKQDTSAGIKHRVEFSGRVVFDGMRKTDFVSLFGASQCGDNYKDWGDCMVISHPGRTVLGEPINGTDGKQMLFRDGFVVFDKLGRVNLIERDWESPNNIDELWNTLFQPTIRRYGRWWINSLNSCVARS